MELVLVVGALVCLGLAALRWGSDSTDGPSSPEWERRRLWRARWAASSGPSGGTGSSRPAQT